MKKVSEKRKLGVFCSLFGGGKFIKGYLENILEQSLFQDTNFYILNCDSPDGEHSVIKKYLDFNNIHYKRLDKDPGLYAAWNMCVDWCQEPYITNWNVDDRKTPWSLEVLLDDLKKDPELDLVYGKTLVTQKPNDTWISCSSKEFYPYLEHSFENLLKNNSPHCMPMWRRSLHERFGYFNAEYKTAADTDMWLRACKGGAKMKLVDEIVGLYYDNPEGRSTDPKTLSEMIKEVETVRLKYR